MAGQPGAPAAPTVAVATPVAPASPETAPVVAPTAGPGTTQVQGGPPSVTGQAQSAPAKEGDDDDVIANQRKGYTALQRPGAPAETAPATSTQGAPSTPSTPTNAPVQGAGQQQGTPPPAASAEEIVVDLSDPRVKVRTPKGVVPGKQILGEQRMLKRQERKVSKLAPIARTVQSSSMLQQITELVGKGVPEHEAIARVQGAYGQGMVPGYGAQPIVQPAVPGASVVPQAAMPIAALPGAPQVTYPGQSILGYPGAAPAAQPYGVPYAQPGGQQQPVSTPAMNDPRPVRPQGLLDSDPEVVEWRIQDALWQQRQQLNAQLAPLLGFVQTAQQQGLQQQQELQERRALTTHNTALLESYTDYIPDFSELSADDQELLTGEIRNALRDRGFDVTNPQHYYDRRLEPAVIELAVRDVLEAAGPEEYEQGNLGTALPPVTQPIVQAPPPQPPLMPTMTVQLPTPPPPAPGTQVARSRGNSNEPAWARKVKGK